MTDANIWGALVGILYVIPVIWLLDAFEALADDLGSRWKAVIWVVFWPVSMIVDIVFGSDE